MSDHGHQSRIDPHELIASRGESRFDRVAALFPAEVSLNAGQRSALVRVLTASDFAFDAAKHEADVLQPALTNAGAIITDELADLRKKALDSPDEASLGLALRRGRRRIMLAIAIAEIGGDASLGDVLGWLTELADCAVQVASGCLYRQLAERWGEPRNATGEAQPFVVLGMGKLGGRELNFSSDIDLIFAYPEEGETDATRTRSNAEFFRRLGQALIRVLDEVTAEGFVFRVDMRLRPHGEVGALAHSFSALEQYYQREGRDWERYALIKARPLTDDGGAGEALLQTLRPFIYRRYLDYSAIESLREMKARVARQVASRGLRDNIKLGAGGIREIEFVCQVFQLIRGGTEPALRLRSLEPTLDALQSLEIMPRDTVGELRRAYRFLRVLENRVQALSDQQIHELPSDPKLRAQLLLAMGMKQWEDLRDALDTHRNNVHRHFQAVFADTTEESRDDEVARFSAIWNQESVGDEALAQLGDSSFQDPVKSLQALTRLAGSAAVRALSANGRRRLDRLVPLMLKDIAHTGGSSQALTRVLTLLSTIARRSAYVSLLCENDGARRRVVRLCGDSAWIAQRVTSHPVLLDELLEQPSPAKREQLQAEMSRRLGAATDLGLEAEMDALRSLQGAQKLRIAVAELSGALDSLGAAEDLSELAEVVLQQSLALARRDLVERYGEASAEGEAVDFGVVAYGRLGAGELGYESDLDLVFLHQDVDSQASTGASTGASTRGGDSGIPLRSFFMRLTQRLIHHLQVLTAAGRLYEVDVRLRPDGSAGLLVCPLETYRSYQLQRAWTWERQSLVRARLLCASEAMTREFEQTRRDALCQSPTESLAEDVDEMRQRMRAELGRGERDIKHGPGGLLDLDFALQYCVLRWSAEHLELTDPRGTRGILRELCGAGIIASERAQALEGASAWLHSVQHDAVLQGIAAPADETLEARRVIAEFYQDVLGNAPPGLQ